jgi:2,4-dienoyl-CoA reductase-like NADH-dependent reductase (Old Yellow Enzyme family)
MLFTPLAQRGITLPNRIVVSPMVQYRARADQELPAPAAPTIPITMSWL